MWKKKIDRDKIMTLGIHVLFVTQNQFFLKMSRDKSIDYILKDNIRKYVSDLEYIGFIRKHKKLENSLLDGDESMVYYVNKLVPKEPKKYPITVEEAQNNYPHLLIDIISLEIQYFLCLAVEMTINKVHKNIDEHLFNNYIKALALAGWSQDGIKKAWEYGSETINQYTTLLEISPSLFANYASRIILNSNDLSTGINLSVHFTGIIETYQDVFIL